jgi:hypothetical protein
LCTEKRRAEAARIREKYPDRIPVRIRSDFSFAIINYGCHLCESHIFLAEAMLFFCIIFSA